MWPSLELHHVYDVPLPLHSNKHACQWLEGDRQHFRSLNGMLLFLLLLVLHVRPLVVSFSTTRTI